MAEFPAFHTVEAMNPSYIAFLRTHSREVEECYESHKSSHDSDIWYDMEIFYYVYKLNCRDTGSLLRKIIVPIDAT